MKEGSFQQRYGHLRRLIDRRLASLVKHDQPRDLRDGLEHVLSAGGKRVRSTLLILSCKAVGGRTVDALNAGAAIEMMHNFTLVHDDIMDNAVERRGRPTVHIKWDVNNALLVGDVLLGIAYECLLKTRTRDLRRVVELFTEGLLEVCEGQGVDLAIEPKRHVTLSDYFKMIEKKTARMIGMSTEIGGLIGGATARQLQALRKFGHYLGRAFQVQDDLLDVVGEKRRLGKTIGGDIVEGKKTYLLLKAVEGARGKDRTVLARMMSHAGSASDTPRRKVKAVTDIYKRWGVIETARQQIQRDTRKATGALSGLPKNDATSMLCWFSELLVKRVS